MASEGAPDHPGAAGSAPQTPSERVCAGQGPVSPALSRLASLLAGSPHNLVSAAERPHVYERHIRECVLLAERVQPSGRWLDLGTGGGLPGLVLAEHHSAASWTLVDATTKKAAAVKEFAAALQLSNVTVLAGRAEALAWDRQHRAQYAGVVARAVAPLVTLTELARGFLAPNGVLVALKGPAWREELTAARRALQVLRLELVSSERLPIDARESWVVTMRAVGPPPAGYPRRDGVPKQDPLRYQAR